MFPSFLKGKNRKEDLEDGLVNAETGPTSVAPLDIEQIDQHPPATTDGKLEDAAPTLNPKEVRVREKLERITYWMDDCFRIPGTERHIGLDPIIGLMPFIGDFGSAAVSLAFVARAAPVLSKYTVTHMLVNVWIDAVTGVVPVVGDLFDIGWKANERNLAMFDDHMTRGCKARSDTDRRWILTIVIVFVVFCWVTTMLVLAAIVLLILYLTDNL